jgi:HK97 family phage major capsid protein
LLRKFRGHFFLRRAKKGKDMTIRELREKRVRLHEEAKLLLPATGKMSAENSRKFDVIMSEIDELGREVRRLEAAEDVNTRWNDVDAELRRTQRPPESRIIGDGDGFDEAVNSQADRRHRRAFRNFLRHGLHPDSSGRFKGLNADDLAVMQRHAESRDLSVGTNASGGYFVPQGFVYELERALKAYGMMLEAASSFDTETGNPMPWPTENDTSNMAEIVAEGQQVSVGDMAIGSLTFGAFKYSTRMVKVSIELIQDSAFDIDQYLISAFSVRLGRKLNRDFTVGAGTTEPKGIVTCVVANNGSAQTWGAGSGNGVPLVAAGSSGNTGGSETGVTSIGSDDLVNLEHSVDRAYRKNGAYMMSDSTLRSLKQILDKYGRPLWQLSISAGVPDKINGYPYYVNEDMAAVATGNVTVLFGDFSKYKYRRVRQIQVLRLTERFADYGQVAFLGFARYDGNLLDAGTKPVTYLKQA